MGEIDHLLADPAVQAAVEAQRAAERQWVLSDDKDPDPQLYCAVTTIVAFCKAGGNPAKILNLAEPAMAASRRDRIGLRVVKD